MEDMRVEVAAEVGMFFSIIILLIEAPLWLFVTLATAAVISYLSAITVFVLLICGKVEIQENKFPSIILYWQTLIILIIFLSRLNETPKIVLCVVAIVLMAIAIASSFIKRIK